MNALIIGATGATGKDLVSLLLKDHDFEEVHVFVRKPLNMNDSKLKVHIVDFKKPEIWEDLVKGDVAFSCLGTTIKAAGSKAAQRNVDYDYQYNFAKTVKENGVENFILLSSFGADSKSKIFYSRIKGELEDSVKILNFKKLTIFQPGMLDRKDSDRIGEILGRKVISFANNLGLFKSQKPLPTSILAQAMINSAKNKSLGFKEIKLGEIFTLAKEK